MNFEDHVTSLSEISSKKLAEFGSDLDRLVTTKIKEFSEKQAQSRIPAEQKKGKSLNDFLGFTNAYTAAASTVSRSLALGGIGIVWIFIKPDAHLVKEPLLNAPLVLLGFSLALDLCQYFFGAISWKIFYEWKYSVWKKRHQFNPQFANDIVAPNIISIPIYLFWFLKILAMLVAYYLLISFCIGYLK